MFIGKELKIQKVLSELCEVLAEISAHWSIILKKSNQGAFWIIQPKDKFLEIIFFELYEGQYLATATGQMGQAWLACSSH